MRANYEYEILYLHQLRPLYEVSHDKLLANVDKNVLSYIAGFSSSLSVHKNLVQTHSKFRRKREVSNIYICRCCYFPLTLLWAISGSNVGGS